MNESDESDDAAIIESSSEEEEDDTANKDQDNEIVTTDKTIVNDPTPTQTSLIDPDTDESSSEDIASFSESEEEEEEEEEEEKKEKKEKKEAVIQEDGDIKTIVSAPDETPIVNQHPKSVEQKQPEPISTHDQLKEPTPPSETTGDIPTNPLTSIESNSTLSSISSPIAIQEIPTQSIESIKTTNPQPIETIQPITTQPTTTQPIKIQPIETTPSLPNLLPSPPEDLAESATSINFIALALKSKDYLAFTAAINMMSKRGNKTAVTKGISMIGFTGTTMTTNDKQQMREAGVLDVIVSVLVDLNANNNANNTDINSKNEKLIVACIAALWSLAMNDSTTADIVATKIVMCLVSFLKSDSSDVVQWSFGLLSVLTKTALNGVDIGKNGVADILVALSKFGKSHKEIARWCGLLIFSLVHVVDDGQKDMSVTADDKTAKQKKENRRLIYKDQFIHQNCSRFLKNIIDLHEAVQGRRQDQDQTLLNTLNAAIRSLET